MLPRQLQNEAFGFVKLKLNSKIPFEKNWQNKPYTYTEITKWIEQGNNYGVIGAIGNLIIIDSDDAELSKRLFGELPETFTVKTSKGFHFYFIVPDPSKKIVLTQNGVHLGEIISIGSQVVGPNCRHPSGVMYKIERDLPIYQFS